MSKTQKKEFLFLFLHVTPSSRDGVYNVIKLL